MFFRLKASGLCSYLQIVESRRDGARVQQHVIATIGRADELAANGGLASLLASGARFCEQVLLLSALDDEHRAPQLGLRRIGAPMAFGRLWEELGCRAVLETLLAGRGFGFAVERAVFATVLHRLMASGSEVEIAVRAAETLEADGIPTRVLSVPCMDLFRAQPEDYRAAVLPEGPARIAIEAAARQPWDWLLMGERGDWRRCDFVGMTGFGASAPADRLYKEFGITAEDAAQKVKALL